MPNNIKELHHTVPRFYLKAWDAKGRAARDAVIFCLRNGVVREGNLRTMGAEKNFYSLQELNDADMDLLRSGIIKDSPETLRPYYEELIQCFTAPHKAKRMLESSGDSKSEQLAEANRLIAEMNENIHTRIESEFQSFLRSMLRAI